MIGALLLCLGAFLIIFIRLDDEALHQQVIAHLEQATGRTVHSETAKLSLQNGASLKLAKLRIDGEGDWRLSADIARFDISVWALLFGELRLSAIDMVHPVLHLDRAPLPKELFVSPVAVRLLQDTPVFSFRQGQILLADKVMADEVTATVRRIEREQQTTWELQSRYAGGDFSSQGYIRSSNTGEDKVFGRISASQLHIDQIKGLPPPSLHYDLLDASLTFSLEDGKQWQWFGNVKARDEHGELPELSWRGKLVGRGLDDFRLSDAFVQFGDKTRLVLIGGCETDKACQVEINTRGANPNLILKAFAIHTPLHGKLDANIHLKQEKKGWNLNGKLGLLSLSWSKTRLPDSVIELAGLHMDSPGNFRLQHANIKPEGENGLIEVSQLQQAGERLNVALRLDGLDGIWAPLGNIFLQQTGLIAQPDNTTGLGGAGIIDGAIQWTSSGQESLLNFSLAADQASMTVGNSFTKPVAVAARIRGRYRRQADRSRLDIPDLQLGESRLSKLSLLSTGGHSELSVASAVLDMNSLKAQGVLLPPPLNGWKGMLEGELEHIALPPNAGPRQWLAEADGALRLKGFGRDGETWTGNVLLRHGQAQTKQMIWQHGAVFADFNADMNISRLRGRLNIARSGFHWSPEESLPGWLTDADIRGQFRETDMQWNDNIWKGIKGAYIARKGRLELDHVRGKLADGTVRSRHMMLEGIPGGVRFSGRAGMSAVNLGKLKALADVAGAKMDGFAFLNAKFSGTLPPGLKGPDTASWRGNGDIEIHHGHWKEAKPAHIVQWKDEAATKLENNAGEGFDRLSTRFSISSSGLRLRRLKLIHGKLSAAGKAIISSTGDISGKLNIRQGKENYETLLGGRWPSLVNLFSQP